MSRTISVAAVGDLQLGDSSICVGFGFASRFRTRALDQAFTAVLPHLAGADIVFGNLETTLAATGLDRRKWRSAQMRGAPEFAAALRRAGFSVVNVANNHAVQHGPASFDETLRHLEAARIAACGVRGEPPWCARPCRLTLPSGATAGVLGYCHRPRQYGPAAPPYAEGTLEQMLADVGRLRDQTDQVIVSLHWGEEFVERPSTDEVRVGRALVEGGAALVLGHHPHVLRPIERYGRGVIAYSLGNFVGDMIWQERLREGGILRCRLGPAGVERADFTPTRIDDGCVPRTKGAAAATEICEAPVEGLPPETYRAAIARTVRDQRLAAYRYALRNLWRFSPGMLLQLAATTARNKLDTVAGPGGG